MLQLPETVLGPNNIALFALLEERNRAFLEKCFGKEHLTKEFVKQGMKDNAHERMKAFYLEHPATVIIEGNTETVNTTSIL